MAFKHKIGFFKSSSAASTDFGMEKKIRKKLTLLNLDVQTIENILKNREKIIEQTAHILEMKYNVTNATAEQILQIIKPPKQTQLKKDQIKEIEKHLNDPKVNTLENIAFLTEIDQNLIADYIETKPISAEQKTEIIKLSNTGYCISDIMHKIKHILVTQAKIQQLLCDYSQQYKPNQDERVNFFNLQKKEISEIIANVGNDTKTFHTYRTIVTETFSDLITRAKEVRYNPIEAFKLLLPQIFYYLKCSLSFEDITRIINGTCKLNLATYDTFHIIFQLSDPVVRGLCIEHYSFSNAIPLYFPSIHNSLNECGKIKFEFCSELWYSIQEYNGLISFGLGRASWNPIGKSSLLDLIFETDFVKRNSQESAFHLQSIDIQMTKNIFAKRGDKKCEKNGKSIEESTTWAYIDCHRYSESNVIQILCQKLNIALIHISHSDFKVNRCLIDADISRYCRNVKYVYVFIRDCEEPTDNFQQKEGLITYISIPNLSNIIKPMIYSELKRIGKEILHLKNDNSKMIGTEFVESVMKDLNSSKLSEVLKDKALIQEMTKHWNAAPAETCEIDYSLLSNYYPIFVRFMSCYYQMSSETDQKVIDRLNQQRVSLKEELECTDMGDVVVTFNAILERNNSGLILWKLSQELSTLTNKVLIRNRENSNDRFSIEILWREALLSSKFGSKSTNQSKRANYKERFVCNFGRHVERGEPFELIDGDNLRFFNKDINILLSQLYKKQLDELSILNSNKSLGIRQAPIVISIFGPQSSGKSTLLNYCFGCKFLTSAGRCTRGIYGALAKLSQPFNRTNQFLILDTEGLDGGGGKDTSPIHFDRTMVLFCLAVSQVVIINVIGDLGEEMQKLLQICAYSLNKLRVSRVVTPKIFFVLNQQANPDPKMHVASMNNLLSKLEESDLTEFEECKISSLIKVSAKNLFVLPNAFNTREMNQQEADLFNGNVNKLTPTFAFANECTLLRESILNKLMKMSLEERTPFKTMDEWLEMSGVIWETIIKYQDIVKHRNIDEMKSNHKLEKIVDILIEEYFRTTSRQRELGKYITQSILKVKELENVQEINDIIGETSEFSEKFENYRNKCFENFKGSCQSDKLLRKMSQVSQVCDDMRKKLNKIIDIEKKKYEDKIKPHKKTALYELKLADKKGRFQKAINDNVDHSLNLNDTELAITFEGIWADYFGNNERKEEEEDRNEDFNNLYTIFKVESIIMENKQAILQRFRNLDYDMSVIIEKLLSEMKLKFEQQSHSFSDPEDFIFPWKENNVPIISMTPFTGREEYEYLGRDTLFQITPNGCAAKYTTSAEIPLISDWVPTDCHSLVNCCSGYLNHADITWDKDEREQILLLASLLKDPKDTSIGTWEKLLKNISSSVNELIKDDPDISHGTVKLLINLLHTTIQHVNYEINHIQAKLTNAAETSITTLVFAYAFKSMWEMKTIRKSESKKMNEEIKNRNLKDFLEKVHSRIKALENWDRVELMYIDKSLSIQHANDLLNAAKREAIADESSIDSKFTDILSYDNILLHTEELIQQELASEPDEEIVCQNNFVIQFICNRNQTMKNLFHSKWKELSEELFFEIFESMQCNIANKLQKVKSALTTLVEGLENNCNKLGKSKEFGFDSETIFEVDENVAQEDHKLKLKIRRCKLKSSVSYLEKYLDPKVTQICFREFFENAFKVDGIVMKTKARNCLLSDKPTDPSVILDNETFKKLKNTQMFNSEQIYNIYEYIREFLYIVSAYKFEFSRIEFEEMVKPLREKLESLIINCPSECPSCGKLCERELHPHSGKCRIKTGHQICSMGGKVWKNDEERTAILLTCGDYKDRTKVKLRDSEVSWAKFKEQTENVWDWSLPSEGKYLPLQQRNREKMGNIWDKFGRGILNYHASKGVNIKYIPYSTFEDALKEFELAKYYICFVIDGTGSMRIDIQKARISVKQLISIYKPRGNPTLFKVVIYRDHCDGDNIIEVFPSNSEFTENYNSVVEFLDQLAVYGGGDGPEAVVDGLGTAANYCKWKCVVGVKNIIIHIFDAPPHGNFPEYRTHYIKSDRANCCCCNHGTLCKFDWKKNVWDVMHNFKIMYHGISTGERFTQFEDAMKTNLGELCGDFQLAGKESVNEAIAEIFIDP